MPHKIGEFCACCGACVAVCPVKAVSVSDDSGDMVINEKLCLDCGLCAKECPHDLIAPDESKNSKKINIGDDQYLEILLDLCIGCSLCARTCPTAAITGVVKEPYLLDRTKCIKCGICLHKCRKNAIKIC